VFNKAVYLTMCIMKESLNSKQWWSTIPPISTTRSNHISSYLTWTQNKNTTYDYANQGPVLATIFQ